MSMEPWRVWTWTASCSTGRLHWQRNRPKFINEVRDLVFECEKILQNAQVTYGLTIDTNEKANDRSKLCKAALVTEKRKACESRGGRRKGDGRGRSVAAGSDP